MFTFIFSLFFVLNTVAESHHISTSDYCSFNESLIQTLDKISCNLSWNLCATNIRETVQSSKVGGWGVVIIGDKTDILNGKIDWHIHSRHSQKCRLLLNNNTVFADIFQTGFQRKNIKTDQENWKLKNDSSLIESCPHSSLRQLLSRFWVEKQPPVLRYRRTNPPKSPKGLIIHKAAKTLSKLFFDETSHKWNIFIAKNATLNIGFNLPYYHFESRPGYCIGKSRDGYTVIAAVIEYNDDDDYGEK
uniref:Uncharacterized protein n=1 Tax=Panagrolaimus sp. PS1159 TaxID=55785 RepID=A0AC35FKH7_9BILA